MEANLREVSGASFIDVDLSKQAATVIYRPTETDLPALREAIGKAGYTAKSETYAG